MSESRGTGLTQRRPTGWERRPAVPMSGAQAAGPQGPSQLRSAGQAQGEFPSQVIDTLADAPGGFITQLIAGRPGIEAQRSQPGNAGNVAGSLGGFPGPNTGLSHTTGKSVVGKTSGRGTF